MSDGTVTRITEEFAAHFAEHPELDDALISREEFAVLHEAARDSIRLRSQVAALREAAIRLVSAADEMGLSRVPDDVLSALDSMEAALSATEQKGTP